MGKARYTYGDTCVPWGWNVAVYDMLRAPCCQTLFATTREMAKRIVAALNADESFIPEDRNDGRFYIDPVISREVGFGYAVKDRCQPMGHRCLGLAKKTDAYRVCDLLAHGA